MQITTSGDKMIRTPTTAIGGLLAATVLALAVMVACAASARADFGIAAFDQQITADAAGDPFTQANGHPYLIRTEIDLNSHLDPEFFNYPKPDADVKDVIVNTPPGEIGNPVGFAQCTTTQLSELAFQEGLYANCPVGSQVGILKVRTDFIQFNVGLFNMVPPVHLPALFGANIFGQVALLTGNVRNGSDYGVTVISPNLPLAIPLDGFTTTFWGTPADPRHDIQRCPWLEPNFLSTEDPATEQPTCTGEPGTPQGPRVDPEPAAPFLTIPGSCPAPGVGLKTNLQVDSWANPGVYAERDLFSHLSPGYPLAEAEWGQQQGTTGCEREPFQPSIAVTPTNSQADTPSGLNVEISLPQEGLLNSNGISTADVKKAVVTLPEGESVSPSAAGGLGACAPGQIGLGTRDPAACPDSSKLGTVEVDTPLLADPMVGSIYLGQPECGPCGVSDDLAGRLVKLYLVVEAHGVILKLAGRVEMDPVTGRIVTTFDNNPQLPFSHLKLNFKAGPRSPLVNPPFCGTYTTQAEFTPWSGTAPVNTTSSFQISSGPEGKPCPSVPQAFGPSFAAGTTNNQAGAFSPLTVSFGRSDGEQQLGGVTVRTPPGLLGSLSAASLCGEPAASNGSCPSSSEIGSLTVSAGAGANPFYVTGGKVFLTGGYKGAPFGLSIMVPAVAGPFNLGTVVVRGSIAVDPITAALTVSTDPLPTILDGIPLDLRNVSVTIGKPGFIFNPTNCNSMTLNGDLAGGLGGGELVTNSFQVTNCAALGFKPGFSASTSGRTSRANGAGLDVKLSYPAGSMGKQANIAKVKVDLPKQLPSRLTTLQKACPDSVFNANPAACGQGSKVGQATAVTPILPEALHGPAYFVSHGGAKFPELVVVLSGYGVTVDLHGETFISPAGITSSTFRAVPDVPISMFELKLPQGPNSALAANGNLCASKLKMPTAFTAQDGATIRQSTPITATGCAKHKARKAKKRKR
jgi:hypothetical protein